MCVPRVQILMPYQRDWILDRSDLKVCEKSRRTGITWATALEAVIVASSKPADGGMNVYFMTYAEEDSKDFIKDCEMWARALGVLSGEVEVETEEADQLDGEDIFLRGKKVTVQILKITFKGGFRIVALAGRPRKFRGKQGYAIIDEGAHVDDLDALLTAANAFVMWGGRISVISTHHGEENPFNKLVDRATNGEDDGFSLHSIPLVEAIEQGLARRIASVRGVDYTDEWAMKWERGLRAKAGPSAAEEYDCIPSRQGEGYIDKSIVALCQDKKLPVLRWARPREWGELPVKAREAECQQWINKTLEPVVRAMDRGKSTSLGVDFARYSDGSVWILGQIDGQVRRCAITIELSCIPIRQQEQILGFLIRRAPRFSKANMDKTGNGFALHEWARENFGRHIEGISINGAWHDEAWPVVQGALSERRTDIPDDEDCADDFKLVETIDGKPRIAKRRTKGRHGTLRHGDFAVALALMLTASKGQGSGSRASTGPSSRRSRDGF